MGSYPDAHAERIVGHCLSVEAGDQVVVQAPPCAEELVVAVAEHVGRRGGNLVWKAESSRVFRAHLRALPPDQAGLSEHLLALMEAADACVYVRGSPNLAATEDVPEETLGTFMAEQQPVHEASTGDRWVVTQYPATGNAQRADMSSAAYRRFVHEAVTVDWNRQRQRQRQLVDRLDEGDRVRIVVGDETDLALEIAGNTAVGDWGRRNLPGGEVFTAPVPDGVEGRVRFDYPTRYRGREVSGVTLTFEDGLVTGYSARRNEAVLGSLLDQEGARRVGELGFGTNEAIDRVTFGDLFDEKMDGTVHIGLGSSYPETVGEGNEGNESTEHVDLVADLGEQARVEVDGTVVYRDGTFAL